MLNNPNKNGYDFTGWTGTELIEQTINVTILKGSFGTRQYTANWKLSGGPIAGIAVGGALLLVLGVLLLFLIVRPRHSNKEISIEMESHEDETQHHWTYQRYCGN